MIIVCDFDYFSSFVNKLMENLVCFFIRLIAGEHCGNTLFACCGILQVKILVAEQLVDGCGIGLDIAQGYFLTSLFFD